MPERGLDISGWPQPVAGLVAAEHLRVVREVHALPEVESTQDEAWQRCCGREGLLVVADVQRAGRGRLGRSWVHAPGAGLACTFTIGTSRVAVERLSLIAGVATAQAIEASAGLSRLGLRWPNDVVEPGPKGRKLAGVLIERRGDLALLGIGINVSQQPEDFAPHLRARAASIAMLAPAGAPHRLDLLLGLVRALDRALLEPAGAVMDAWSARDVLLGTQRTFLHDGQSVTGRVIGLDPLHLITLRTDTGERVRLPALSTSLVHE